jgi:hypothetical protein
MSVYRMLLEPAPSHLAISFSCQAVKPFSFQDNARRVRCAGSDGTRTRNPTVSQARDILVGNEALPS